MSGYLEAAMSALRETVGTAWPEIDPNGLVEEDHARLIPWSNLTPPYGAIVWDPDTSPHQTLDSLEYQFTVDIYRVEETEGPSDDLRAKLEELRDYLWDNSPDPGQVLEVPALSTSVRLLPNQLFLSDGLTYRAGRVTVELRVG